MAVVCRMEAVVDAKGRVALPKQLRDAVGLTPGTTVDVSLHGKTIHMVPAGLTARLERAEGGRLVARADTVVTDEMMFALIESDRH